MRDFLLVLVDDEEADRYLLKRMIKRLNISPETFEADNGRAALEVLADLEERGSDTPPILIFLDINMPIMNGFEFLEAYAKSRETGQQHSSHVFIMYTSSESEKDRDRVKSYEFVRGFFVKGNMSPEGLLDVIGECLDSL